MPNFFQGLATGPIDHRATSVINSISTSIIDMGALVVLNIATPLPAGQLLPRVKVEVSSAGDPLAYGVAVGGDNDGIYGEGFNSTDDTTRATTGTGQGVKIVTRGRCPALIKGFVGSVATATPINIGDPLTHHAGRLQLAEAGNTVVARALQKVASGTLDIIPVEVNKEGVL